MNLTPREAQGACDTTQFEALSQRPV